MIIVRDIRPDVNRPLDTCFQNQKNLTDPNFFKLLMTTYKFPNLQTLFFHSTHHFLSSLYKKKENPTMGFTGLHHKTNALDFNRKIAGANLISYWVILFPVHTPASPPGGGFVGQISFILASKAARRKAE